MGPRRVRVCVEQVGHLYWGTSCARRHGGRRGVGKHDEASRHQAPK